MRSLSTGAQKNHHKLSEFQNTEISGNHKYTILSDIYALSFNTGYPFNDKTYFSIMPVLTLTELSTNFKSIINTA